jgi:hypothetical protein
MARLAEEHAAARADAHRRTSKRRGPRWRRLSNASPRRMWPEAWRWWWRSASDTSISTLSCPSMQRPSDRRSVAPSPPSSRTPSAAVASVCRRRAATAAGWFSAAGSMTALGRPTLHRHHHRAHLEPTPPAGTPIKTSSFSFLYYISLYYVKTIYISMKSMYFAKFRLDSILGWGARLGNRRPPYRNRLRRSPFGGGVEMLLVASYIRRLDIIKTIVLSFHVCKLMND